jgi:hypothetical protein
MLKILHPVAGVLAAAISGMRLIFLDLCTISRGPMPPMA